MKTIEEELTGMQAMNELSNALVATRNGQLEVLQSLIFRMAAVTAVLDQVRYMVTRSVVRVPLPAQAVDYREDKELTELLASFGLKIVDCQNYRDRWDIAIMDDEPTRQIGDQLQSQCLPRFDDFLRSAQPLKYEQSPQAKQMVNTSNQHGADMGTDCGMQAPVRAKPASTGHMSGGEFIPNKGY